MFLLRARFCQKMDALANTERIPPGCQGRVTARVQVLGLRSGADFVFVSLHFIRGKIALRATEQTESSRKGVCRRWSVPRRTRCSLRPELSADGGLYVRM
ncbi:unnamed protein product [Merluccius merluccius]